MLARLQADPGIEVVEVDHRGELLHVVARSAVDSRALVDRLYEMGFAAEPVNDAIVVDRWYGPDAVGDLSREEADVIAQRVVPIFVRSERTSTPDIDELIAIVAAALHECFLTNRLDATAGLGVLNSACARAVEGATRQRLGNYRAMALGKAVETDLATRSAFKE